ncbi:mechanosensitive ion channel family protein [Spirochaeta africana]|uniref:Small-conductance mechanosensitive channel n=1 Tax=Spirochaeta africana (strain ATCC 700263 / DSM 8902 / Z-7692) TaxID=889378 RepID=H9UM53_SPIAZ|nr:mechanosensitive ion channel domain-containing protein [Spirochaeta africana]AFG38596.1 small-conductance mechanosensitive channel [Spirochaeta africana DSM 8902]
MSELLESLGVIMTTRISLGGIAFRFTLLQVLLELLLPVLVYIGVAHVIRRAVSRWQQRADWEAQAREQVRRVSGRVLRSVGLILGAVLIGRLLGAEIAATFLEAGRILNQPLIESGSTRISIVTLLLVVPVILIAGKVGLAVKQYAKRTFLARLDLERQSTIADLLRYATAITVLIVGISMLGINLSSLAVLFGVLGIGIGFGLQDVIANMFAGLVIIMARPIKEGDRVLAGQFEGNVVNIRLLNTAINTLTNETIIVPNSSLINKEVYNFSYDSPAIILVNKVQVSYESDLDLVLEVLRRIPERNPYALRGQTHQAYVKSFDDSGITVELRTWIRTVYDKMAAHSWVNLEIWREFRGSGIQIPFPQLDLHLPGRGDPVPGAGE